MQLSTNSTQEDQTQCQLCANFRPTADELNALVAQRFFNCVAKYIVKDPTNKANEQSGQPAKRDDLCSCRAAARTLTDLRYV